MKLKSQVAVVTGAAAGIGRSIAERFSREGAAVVLADNNAAAGEAAAAAISNAGGECRFVAADVASEDDIRRLAGETLAAYGRLDILCNNAAVLLAGQDAPAHLLSREAWDRTIAVNLTGYWLCAKYLLPPMIEQRSGSIIHMASPTALIGFTSLTAYSTSKGGVFGLLRAMAADYGKYGIRVNAIVPGTIDTPMNAVALSVPGNREYFASLSPLGRMGAPDDLAGVAAFLASADSAFCTGGVFTVDGGLTAVVPPA